MAERKKILITGAAGYIGDCIIDHLVNQENNQPPHEIHVVDKLLYTDRYMRPGINFRKMDVTSFEFYEFIKEQKFDVIIHLVAIVGEPACELMPIEATKINEIVVRDLCKIIKEYSPDTRLIFASTCSVYGNNDEFINEESGTSPLGVYAKTKLNAEEHVRTIKNHLIFRLPTLFGMSTPFGRFRTDLVANVLALRACEGQKLVVFGGEQWRPIAHVKDIGRIFAEATTSDIIGTYIPGGHNYKIIDIANEIDSIIQGSGGVEKVSMDMNESRNYKIDSKKAVSAGIKFNYSLKEGISEMEECIKDGRIKNPWDMKFDNGRFVKHITKE